MRHLDVALSEQIVDLRWGPLTSLMMLVSAWWVKDFLFLAAALLFELRLRGRPWRSLAVGIATLLGALAADWLKPVFDRPRPFVQHLWSGLGSLPHSSSMPSGHAATATAAGVAVAILLPPLRVPALIFAGLVCVSRVYLGVHFVGDVLAGALLGAALAAGVAWGATRVATAP